MKAMKVWLVFIIFNIGSNFILYSSIFPSHSWAYQSAYVSPTVASQLNYSSPNSMTDVQQLNQITGLVNLVRGSITFDWMFDYLSPVPGLLAAPNIVGLRFGLLIVAGVINLAALIELWLRFRDPLS